MFVLVLIDSTGTVPEKHCAIYNEESSAVFAMLDEVEDVLLANDGNVDEERTFCSSDEGEMAEAKITFLNGDTVEWFVLESDN